jgi:hypothetical protein
VISPIRNSLATSQELRANYGPLGFAQLPRGSLAFFGKKSPLVNFDVAAKMRKKHKNQISGLLNSMCYNEQKS